MLTREIINDQLAGNLCRCTGYRPIINAALQSCSQPDPDHFASTRVAINNQLIALGQKNQHVLCGDDRQFFAAPASVDELAKLYAQHPQATLVGGATDVGLWITKQLRTLPKIIHTGRVTELLSITHTTQSVTIGAGVTYAQAYDHLAALDDDIGEVLRRLGSVQIRASGTLGGNIANGSPIGDSPPLLIALDAVVHLRLGEDRREVPIADFFVDYGEQDRRPGELITAIEIPRLNVHQRLRSYKISKRFDQDISALLGAFRFDLDATGVIHDCRLAFGGMAATPCRAKATEAQLRGKSLTELIDHRNLTQAVYDITCMLTHDFSPIDDMRASAQYRLHTAQQLIHKVLLEIGGTPSTQTRIVGIRHNDKLLVNMPVDTPVNTSVNPLIDNSSAHE